MANDKAVSEPVCLTDRRGKSASRSQNIILLRTHWQKMTEFTLKCAKAETDKTFFIVPPLCLQYGRDFSWSCEKRAIKSRNI